MLLPRIPNPEETVRNLLLQTNKSHPQLQSPLKFCRGKKIIKKQNSQHRPNYIVLGELRLRQSPDFPYHSTVQHCLFKERSQEHWGVAEGEQK